MLSIISPSEFTTIPWKNGLGETTELAINEHATLDNFIWRLSIASVANDGVFSDFSGYQRNLILIEGQGITLTHDGKTKDVLVNQLDLATFDGGSETMGTLAEGAIKDFNIITAKHKVTPNVRCLVSPSQVEVKLANNSVCFAFSLSGELVVQQNSQQAKRVPQGYLAKLSVQKDGKATSDEAFCISGKQMIVVQLEINNN